MSLSSLCLRKYSDENDAKPEAYTPHLDPETAVSTVQDLRAALQKTGNMDEGSLFLLPTGFALARIDEPQKPWEILKMDEKTIAILSTPSSSSTHPPPTSEIGRSAPSLASPYAIQGRQSSPKDFTVARSGELKGQKLLPVAVIGTGGRTRALRTFLATIDRQVSPLRFITRFPKRPPLEPIIRASQKLIWNAANLFGPDWDAIYEKNACLRGVILGREPVCAPRKLIDEGCLGACLTHTTGDAVTRRTHTVSNELDSKYATFGWSQAALGVITQFIAGIEASRKVTAAHNASSTAAFCTSFWRSNIDRRNDRCLLQFTMNGLEVTQEFIDDVDAVSREKNEGKQRELLDRLFKDYGHVFRMTTILGGSIVAIEKQQGRTVTDQEEEETTGTIGVFAGQAGAKASAGWRTFMSDASKVNIEDSSTTIIGGSNPTPWNVEGWVNTLDNYQTWSVIKVDRAIPVLDLIPGISEKKIPSLIGVWTNNTRLAFSYGNIKGYIPVIPEHNSAGTNNAPYQYYWIGQTLDPNRALLVRELIPGALSEASCLHEAWKSKHTCALFTKRMRLISPIPGDIENFVPIVPCISNDPPQLSDNPWKYYRTVNRQLVVHVTGGETIFHPTKAQGCCIQPVVQVASKKPVESSVDLGLFVASHGTKPAIWGIKADKIHFLPE
ncbi:hypothetical protein PIIN_05796 [Serendipita indica DSM 11827]|uniref:MACPF-like domain-containing protein n=1 Tax=Serendipita indica (strain DSM 11827) TaxID=1109443 RepID=G4TKL4_SERID|nr:hypothetical protein PIIN_05796 [Serendipita indica DSM 11827]